MDLGERADHAAVALVCHCEDSAGLRDCDVRAGDAHVRMGEFVSHHLAGRLDFFRNDRFVLYLCIISEKICDLLFVQMQSGHDHVNRGIALERDDEFAEVSLLHEDAVFAEDLVHVDFFGSHRFGFDDGLHTFFFDQIADELNCLIRAGGMEDVAAAGRAVLCELVDHLIDVISRISLDSADVLAGLFKVHAFI